MFRFTERRLFNQNMGKEKSCVGLLSCSSYETLRIQKVLWLFTARYIFVCMNKLCKSNETEIGKKKNKIRTF